MLIIFSCRQYPELYCYIRDAIENAVKLYCRWIRQAFEDFNHRRRLIVVVRNLTHQAERIFHVRIGNQGEFIRGLYALVRFGLSYFGHELVVSELPTTAYIDEVPAHATIIEIITGGPFLYHNPSRVVPPSTELSFIFLLMDPDAAKRSYTHRSTIFDLFHQLDSIVITRFVDVFQHRFESSYLAHELRFERGTASVRIDTALRGLVRHSILPLDTLLPPYVLDVLSSVPAVRRYHGVLAVGADQESIARLWNDEQRPAAVPAIGGQELAGANAIGPDDAAIDVIDEPAEVIVAVPSSPIPVQKRNDGNQGGREREGEERDDVDVYYHTHDVIVYHV